MTRRARPDRIPVVCFEIVGLFDHVVTLLKALANSLDSDQARNINKVSKHELGPRHEIFLKEVNIKVCRHEHHEISLSMQS